MRSSRSRAAHSEFVKLLAKGQKGKPDKAYPLAYFLKSINAPNPKKRVRLVDKIGSQGETNFKPEGLVFSEDPSTLRGPNGREVTSW